MTHLDIIRAWKDEDYRLSLSDAERALLPAHPAGLITLTDTQLEHVGGGNWFYKALEYDRHTHDGLGQLGQAMGQPSASVKRIPSLVALILRNIK